MKTDFRHALRALARTPGFTLLATVSLAVGIGASTAVFSLVNAVYYRPLPFHPSGALVAMELFDGRKLCRHECRAELTAAELNDWTESLGAIDALAEIEQYRAVIVDRAGTAIGQGAAVSANFLSLLGVRPLLGRPFDAADDRPGAENVVVLSYSFWRDQYNGDSNVIGRELLLDGSPFQIIGVLPSTGGIGRPLFVGDSATAPFFVPLGPYTARNSERRHAFTLLGRLRPGTRLDALRAQVAVLIARSKSDPLAPQQAVVLPLRAAHARAVASAPYLLFLGAVAFVLLLVCTNLGGLFLARFQMRQREILVRAALGATWSHLARQFACEGLVCVGLGGMGGIVIASVATRLSKFLPAAGVPYWTDIVLDGRVLLFAGGLCVICVICMGIVPAIVVSSRTSDLSLKDMNADLATGRRVGRHRPVLIAVEVQLALVLLTGSGLFGKAFLTAATRDIGRAKESVVLASFAGRGTRPLTSAEERSLAERVVERLRALPGTIAAAVRASGPPYDGLTREGDSQITAVSPALVAELVTSDYFRAAGIPVTAGRTFNTLDGTSAPPVVVLDDETARWLFPNERAIGRRIKLGDATSASDWMTIVGIVATTRSSVLDRPRFYPQLYQPLAQSAPGALGITAVTSTRGPTEAMVASVRGALREVAPNVPLVRLASIEQLIAQELAPLRLTAFVLGSFAVISLAIAALGVYGVVTQLVMKRSPEAGLRMALGAQRAGVLWLMMRSTIALTSVGIAGGLVTSLALTRVVRAFLYGESATDFRVLLSVTLALLATAAAAAFIPARRATRVDPAVALRNL
jgi:putative ABC transport system permease protein